MRMATFNILHGRSVHDGSVELDRLVDSISSSTQTSSRCRRSTWISPARARRI